MKLYKTFTLFLIIAGSLRIFLNVVNVYIMKSFVNKESIIDSLLSNNSYNINENNSNGSVLKVPTMYELELKQNNDLFGPNVTHQIDSKLLLSPYNICQPICPYLLILVLSEPSNLQQRMAIRETYGSLSNDRISEINGVNIQHTVRVLFLLGTKSRKTDIVKREFSQYKDIIQYDFEESYSNLTLKILHGFKWITQFCSNSKYVTKVDGDTFLNVAMLLQALENYTDKSDDATFGRIYHHRMVLRIGRWMVPKTSFPRSIYPDYLSGTAYTMTSKLLPRIIELARHYRFPWVQVEDAFITGILATETLGARIIGLRGCSTWGESHVSPCQFVKSGRISFSTMFTSGDRYKYQVWEALKHFKHKCK